MAVTRKSFAAWSASLLVLASAGLAHGEGTIGLRSGYYKERSTRVIQPMLDAQVDTESGTVDAHVLVDSITSASPAAGNAIVFSERRYEGGVGYTHRFGVIDLGASVRSSTEADYTSHMVGMNAKVELFDRNLTLELAMNRGFDTITNGVAVGPTQPRIEEHLTTGLTSLSVSQLLGPSLVASMTLDLADLHGYQANVYRRVFGGAVPAAERVPELRLRLAARAGLRGYLSATRSTLVLGYGYYLDDWGIRSHTGELRWIQEVVDGLEVRARYRFYTQTAARFWRDTYDLSQIENPAQYITSDGKLDAMTTHTFGGQLVVALGLFGAQGGWRDVRLDAVVERLLQDSVFGNAWQLGAGVTVPF